MKSVLSLIVALCVVLTASAVFAECDGKHQNPTPVPNQLRPVGYIPVYPQIEYRPVLQPVVTGYAMPVQYIQPTYSYGYAYRPNLFDAIFGRRRVVYPAVQYVGNVTNGVAAATGF